MKQLLAYGESRRLSARLVQEAPDLPIEAGALRSIKVRDLHGPLGIAYSRSTRVNGAIKALADGLFFRIPIVSMGLLLFLLAEPFSEGLRLLYHFLESVFGRVLFHCSSLPALSVACAPGSSIASGGEKTSRPERDAYGPEGKCNGITNGTSRRTRSSLGWCLPWKERFSLSAAGRECRFYLFSPALALPFPPCSPCPSA